MRTPNISALRGLRSVQPPAVESPTETRLSVLYLPSAARDRLVVRDRLSRAGANVSIAADMPEALRMLHARAYGLIVVDLAGEAQAVATIRVLRAQSPAIPVIGVMDPADPATAAEALTAGAVDLLPWPFEERDVLGVLSAARDRTVAATDGWPGSDDKPYWHSPAMRLVADAARAAVSRASGVLIVGESGTGRTLIARWRHDLDNEYVNRPFVIVDCDTHVASDLERRLFGVTDPADVNVTASAEAVSRSGALVAAQGGSLFLKNIAGAPARVQDRLARVLRDRELYSIDVNEIIPLDVRVIAAAKPDVDAALADGRLRRDLVERLAQTRIDAPSFHRRREDLPFLAVMFLRRACELERSTPKRFSRAALALIAALPWRRNAPEMAEAMAAIARGTRQGVIQIDDVLDHVSLGAAAESAGDGLSLRNARARFEREYISRALVRNQGRVGDAARALGIQRTNLYRKVRQLKVSKTLLSSQK